ncbi:MAG: hypothetical protein COB37_02500 [Kordiimonadales bacterium]|nr:MAG: hypothetical protein COB37_02500 [Kordiimonadales bacterium]
MIKRIAILFLAAATSWVAATPMAAADDKFLESMSQQLRFREAQSYKYKASQRDISVGVEVFGKKVQRRIIGNRTGSFVTLDVAITNDTQIRVHLNDIYVTSGGKIVRQEDLHEVVRKIDPGGGGKGNLHMSILRMNLFGKSLQNGVIEPGETVQGIVFIRKKHIGKKAELHVRIQNLKRLAYLEYKIPFSQK